MKDQLKLFIWTDVLRDFTPGIGFALASNVDEARHLILDKFMSDRGYQDPRLIRDLESEPVIISQPKGFYRFGGA